MSSILLPRPHLRRDLHALSWHPKVTPYRLIVLSTTIGLGSAKAVLTQSGSTVIPTTLEWLVGTVLFLLFFSVSAYDSRETFPKSLSWLFENDCVDLIWWLIESFSSRRRPQYFSDEKLTIVDGSVYHPPITAYRILVSSAATSFGASKAVLAYLRLSTAVTWSDWALAVPVTTILYVLGLYEYNSSSMWSHFFVQDRSRDIRTFVTWITQAFGFLLCIVWILLCGLTFWYTSTGSGWSILLSQKDEYFQGKFTTLVLGATGLSWVLFWRICLILAMIRGVISLFVLAQPFLKAVVGSNRLLSQHLRTWTPRLENTVSSVTTTAAVCILVHTAIHGFRFIGIFTLCMTFLFCTLTYIVVLHEATEPLGVRMLFSILPCIFVFATLGSFIWLLKVVHSFIKPAVYWHQGKRAWGDTLAGL